MVVFFCAILFLTHAFGTRRNTNIKIIRITSKSPNDERRCGFRPTGGSIGCKFLIFAWRTCDCHTLYFHLCHTLHLLCVLRTVRVMSQCKNWFGCVAWCIRLYACRVSEPKRKSSHNRRSKTGGEPKSRKVTFYIATRSAISVIRIIVISDWHSLCMGRSIDHQPE